MSAIIPSLQQYEFNAKSLSPDEVARSFVAPTSAFDRLLTRNNTLVLGPRGSGKTTLLKMLTRKALLHWDGLTMEHYGERVRFHAAFVPADRAWGAQLQAADRSRVDGETSPQRGEAAFAIQTMIALAVAFREARDHQDLPRSLAHLSVNLESAAEVELVKALEESLEVRAPVPTLMGFEIGLRNALMRIDPSEGANAGPFWADASRLGDAIANCLTIFSSYAQSPTEHWALLFDELEIAPPPIKAALIQSLRGFDQRLVLKLALVPFLRDMPTFEGHLSPQVGHDFEVVNLSYPHKQDAQEFSRDLALRVFSRLGLSTPDLIRVFGPSSFQAGRARVSSYVRATDDGRDPLGTVFRDLASKDDTFAAYLSDKGLLNAAAHLGENERAASVRKILPSVILRDYFIREYRTGQTPFFRSRKASAALYTGFPSILEVADGNPRTLLYLLIPLVDSLEQDLEHNSQAVIDVNMQARAILRVSYTLVSLLRTLPPSWKSTDNPKGLMSFIDAIGNSLQNRLLRGPFEPEYVGSFVVPSDAPDAVVSAVGDALNAGALIHLPDEQGLAESALVGLRSRRFRLSYTLAPRYRLPLTAGHEVSLASLLAGRSGVMARGEQTNLDLGNLR